MAVALIVIVLTHPHISHLQTHTLPLSSLLTIRSYQHSVPIKSCALNLIKPLIYVKHLISSSTLVCVSQGTLLPREGDLAAPTLCWDLSSHAPTILVFCYSSHMFFKNSPPPPLLLLSSSSSCSPVFLLQLLSDLLLPWS